MNVKDREVLLNAIIGLIDKAIKNNTKPFKTKLKAKIAELEAELDMYRAISGSTWSDLINKNQKLREAIKRMYYDSWNCEYCEKNADILQKALEE
jgi:hypothetical protein